MENYYNLGIEEIEKKLNTNKEGLSDKEINDRIESDNSVAFFFWEMAELIEREIYVKKE